MAKATSNEPEIWFEFATRYEQCREIIQKTISIGDLFDVWLFNEIIRFELLSKMREAVHSGKISSFKKDCKKINEIILNA